MCIKSLDLKQYIYIYIYISSHIYDYLHGYDCYMNMNYILEALEIHMDLFVCLVTHIANS